MRRNRGHSSSIDWSVGYVPNGNRDWLHESSKESNGLTVARRRISGPMTPSPCSYQRVSKHCGVYEDLSR